MEFHFHSGYSEPLDQIELARAAEEIGLDGMTLSDHLFLTAEGGTPYPYTADGSLPFARTTPWPDALVMAGALGTATTRVKFFTNVYILPLRNPLITAKAAATAAIVSRGRLVLGVGLGWMREEFAALRAPFGKRGRATDEAIRIMRTIWATGGHPEHHSDIYDFTALVMLPKPERSIPIFIGGDSEAALNRTAHLGDGYSSRPETLERSAEILAEIHRRMREIGRDPAELHFRSAYKGTAGYDEVVRLAEMGAHSIHVRLWPDSETSLAAKRARLEEFATTVIAPFRERNGG